MIAIFAMSTPEDSNAKAALFLRNTVRPVTDPYLFLTSQWQYWNLFAPNPTNWVTEYRIEALRGNAWETVTVISGPSLETWRRSDELKVLERMDEEGTDAMRERYLYDACGTYKIGYGTPARMIRRLQVLERETPGIPAHGDWIEEQKAFVFCPHTTD